MVDRPNPYAPVVAIAAAWWLLSDLASVWGPSLITVFGQAASTPAELMGLFALGCVVASFPLVRAASSARAGRILLLAIALVARLVLAFVPGGQVQLWAASAGLAAALAWLAWTVHAYGRSLAAGTTLGWLAIATVAAFVGTWGPYWRTDAFGVTVTTVLLIAVLATAPPVLDPPAPVGDRAPSRRQAWSLLPLGLVAGIALSPGRASAVDPDLGPAVLVLGWALALLVVSVRAWPAPGRAGAAALAVAGTAASMFGTTGTVPGTLGTWTLAAFALTPAALAVLLQADPAGRPARLVAPLGGAVLWVLAFFAYYAGYDLGYTLHVLPVLVVALVGAFAVWAGRRGVRADDAPRPDLRAVALVSAVAVLMAASAALAHPVPDEDSEPVGEDLSVVAWNLRMGYGMDGTFRPEAVAELLGGADVVLLSEIDRGWLLNGGQDQLAILARLTGKRLHFAPAADPVWGDAVLTSLPVREVQGHPLESYGAVTGAGALAVRVDAGGQEVWTVSTHVQPTTTEDDGTIDQAGDLADLVTELSADAPVVLGGDFNFTPDSPSYALLLEAGLVPLGDDAFTSPADDPLERIDHLFATAPLTDATPPGDPGLEPPRVWPSDHRPVFARIALG